MNLHEIRQVALFSVLVADHLVFSVDVVVHVVFLPLELLALFCQSGVFSLLCDKVLVSIAYSQWSHFFLQD